MAYRCDACGLVVEEMQRWKRGECPEDEYQHHWVEKEVGKA